MGVNHSGFDVPMAKQFLNGANVLPVLEQLDGETLTDGMRRCRIVDFGEPGGIGLVKTCTIIR